MSVNPVLICWIFSFLPDRPQQVQVGQALSSLLTTNTGALQGCVLSLVLFILYTADCCSKEDGNVMVKFADDTSLSGLISSLSGLISSLSGLISSLSGLIQEDDSAYSEAVEELTEWCDRNYLELNMTKTKELIINFRKGQYGPDRHQGPASGNSHKLQVPGHHHRQQVRLVAKHWGMLQESEPVHVLSQKLEQFKVDKNILVHNYQTII